MLMRTKSNGRPPRIAHRSGNNDDDDNDDYYYYVRFLRKLYTVLYLYTVQCIVHIQLLNIDDDYYFTVTGYSTLRSFVFQLLLRSLHPRAHM